MQMEFRKATQAFSEPVNKIKTLLQLRLTMHITGHKKCTYCFGSINSLSKESVGPLPCVANDLVGDRIRNRDFMFSLPHSSKIMSYRPLCLVKIQGRKVPGLDGNRLRDHLRKFGL